MKKTVQSLPLLLLVAFNTAVALPKVQYWTDPAQSGWLLAACEAEGAVRLTLTAPDGDTMLDWIGTSASPGTPTQLHSLADPELPVSAWWSRPGALEDLLQANANAPITATWTVDGDTAQLTPPANQSTRVMEPPHAFARLAAATPLDTLDPLVEATGLSFQPHQPTLPIALLNLRFQQIHLEHDRRMRTREADDPGLADAPAHMAHELRLLQASPDRYTALVITKAKRRFASTSISLETLHLQRQPDESWEFYNPLDAITDPITFREAIRHALNAQDADGDFFAEKHPNPLAPKSRTAYLPLQIGSKLLLLFEPYVVAPGAFGTITIGIDLESPTPPL